MLSFFYSLNAVYKHWKSVYLDVLRQAEGLMITLRLLRKDLSHLKNKHNPLLKHIKELLKELMRIEGWMIYMKM